MSNKVFHPLVIVIVALAFWGFVHQLLNNPKALLVQIIVIAAIGFGLLYLYRRFLATRFGAHSPQQRKTNVVPHRRTNPEQAKKRKQPTRSIARRRSAPNLTVIEGKKNKKRNRALF